MMCNCGMIGCGFCNVVEIVEIIETGYGYGDVEVIEPGYGGGYVEEIVVTDDGYGW